MTLPIDFYFQEAKTNEHCTDTQSGAIHVDNFLQGKPHWIQPALPRQSKQKKLILSDWTARFWSEEKRIAMKDSFTQLLDEGFSLYCYMSGKLEPITKKNLTYLLQEKVLNTITPSNPEDIYRVARAQNISRDQLLLLDDYWMECLHQNCFDMERTLYLSHYTQISPSHQKTIIQTLTKAKPPLSSMIFDSFNSFPTEKTWFSQDVKDSFPQIKTHYQHLIITTELWIWLESQLTQDSTASQDNQPSFKLFDDQLTVDDLRMIQSIKVDPLCINFNLHKTLMLAPNLKKIDLSDCETIVDVATGLGEVRLEQLEEINLKGTELTGADVTALLKAAPNLKNINLSFCQDIGTFFENLSQNCLGQLEYINFHMTTITGADVTALLKAAPNLKNINLSYCKNIADLFNGLRENSLEKLEETHLNHTTITGADVTALLKAAPNLKKLYLSCCQNSAEFFDGLSKNSLQQLEEINLESDELTGANATALLKAAPNLKKINLSCCQNIAGLFDGLSQNSLGQLEYINLNRVTITGADVTALLKAAPNLKKIDLSGCQTISEALKDFSENSLEKLEEILLASSSITALDLAALLKAAPNLKKIDLNFCETIADILKGFGEDSLEKLEEIALASSSITAVDLAALLKAAPNLKIINLSGCFIKGAFQNLMPYALKKLQSIELDLSRVTEGDRNYILYEIPSLHSDCKQRLLREERRQVIVRRPNLGMDGPKPTESFLHVLDEKIHSPRPHDPQAMKDFKPIPENKPFKYTGTQDAHNQKMVIEKFSQYLITLKGRPELAAKIQDGMCNALSYFFKELAVSDPNLTQWADFTTHLSQWNGDPHTISSELEHYFDRLERFVISHQVDQSHITEHFIGENLGALESVQQPNNTSFILRNPWHAVCVQKIGTHYQFYDPNNAEVMTFNSLDELQKQVVSSIGKLISVCDIKIAIPTPQLTDINEFIADGGLFVLIGCENSRGLISQIPAVKAQIPPDFKFNEHALEGLLLRNTNGVPAWIRGLQSKHEDVKILTTKLLAQFQVIFPDAAKLLKQSAADVPAYQQHDTAAALIESCPSSEPANAPLRELMLDVLRQQQQVVYKQTLSTWSPKQSAPVSMDEYCQQHVSLVNNSGEKTTNQLVECQSTAQLHHLAAILHGHCKSTSRPVFYIDSPDDLTCSASFVQTDPDHPSKGHLQKGPGGPLHDFLTKHQHTQPGPVLIVNYERFKPDDIVRFNGLIDAKPQADGTDLPADTVLIGLTNTSSMDYYNGADFKSRFHTLDNCPFTSEELEQSVHLPSIIESIDASKHTVINLYHAPDWKSRLLGRWVIHGQSLTYQAGELQQAIEAGEPIEIQNGLWEDDDFALFWNKIRQEGIYHANRWIQVPETCPIVRSSGYDWNILKASVQTIAAGLSPASEALVLNQGTFGHFFDQYEVDDASQSLQPALGYLDQANGKSLTVNVTSTLSEDNWARLLSECSKRSITLHVHCAPGVELPDVFNIKKQALTLLSLWNKAAPTEALTVIESTDTDTTVAMLEPTNAWRVIDVSECQVSDLLLRIKGELQDNATTPHFKFTQHEGALLQAQKTGQPLILKGHFSQALIDGLAPYLLAKSNEQPPQGQLIIVSDNTDAFSFMPNCIAHQVTRDEKIAHIKASSDVIEQLDEFIDKEPLSQLQTRAAFLQMQQSHDISNKNPWQGLRDLPQSGVVVAQEPLDLASSAQQSQAFTKHRKEAVMTVLNNQPCVFLSGLSGIGKTTFVERELCSKDSNHQLFSGENQVQAWAMDSSGKTKVLFLDEANLSPRQWSEFEGLFNQQPGILIEGIFYPLTKHHKVVFAGNPLSYGDDRQLAPFFERRVSTVLFEPLSKAVIHEKILKPIFERETLDDEQISTISTISNLILDAYALICQGSSTEVLISPRELQMMALIAVGNYKNTPSVPLTTHVKQAVHEMGQSLIPPQHKPLLQQFNDQFKPTEASATPRKLIDPSFVLTPSRQPIVRALHERLQLLAWRKTNESTLNADQKYGGLGGLILDGEPGIGKSELIIRVLIDAGFQEQHLSSPPVSTDKLFYRMPVSMTLSDKKALLLKAFNEGAVIIIDEINSSPMMEQFLNALLMGKNPDTGELPQKVGFMVIGTQNPATMAGRRIASTALQRRITTMTIPEYHHDEMKQILLQKGVEGRIADDMITSYLERRSYAMAHQLSPVPCFRDLLKLADAQLVADQRTSKKPPMTADLAETAEPVIESIETARAAEAADVDDEVDINTWDMVDVADAGNVVANMGQEIYKMITKEVDRAKQSMPFFFQGKKLKADVISVLGKLLEIGNDTHDTFKSEFGKLQSTPSYQNIKNTKDKKMDTTKRVLLEIEIKLGLAEPPVALTVKT